MMQKLKPIAGPKPTKIGYVDGVIVFNLTDPGIETESSH